MKHLCRVALLAFLLIMAVVPKPTAAHAILSESIPPAGSQQESPPELVRLTFNERIEKELMVLQVRDSHGQHVTRETAEASPDQLSIRLKLPTLNNGTYTVSYRVLSSDGHPIEGSYVFLIGPGTGPDGQSAQQQPVSSTSGDPTGGAALYGFRIAAFMGMLGLTGWIIWSRLASSPGSVQPTISKRNKRWTLGLQWFYLATHLLFAGSTIYSLSPDSPWSNLTPLLTETAVGLSLLLSLLLAAASFAVLYRSRWLDALWIAAVFAVKCLNGHAWAASAPALTVPLNFIHLAGAAVWAGGLLYILAHGFKDNKHVLEFLPRFSKAALYSIIVLTVTGFMLTMRLQPDWSLLPRSLWGQLLLAKTALALLVAVTAMLIRRRMSQSIAPPLLLRIDFAMMILILALAAVLTRMSPLPENEPLTWKEQAGKLQVEGSLTPSAPGVNRIQVQVRTPEASAGPPKYVQVYLKSGMKEEIPPIEVQLRPVEPAGKPSDGHLYQYENTGPYLPFKGKWELILRVMSAEDDESVLKKEFTIY